MTVRESCRLVSFGLVVLIWLVQAIIYPAFAAIEPGRFPRWHAGYTRAITWVVGPLMLAQVVLLGWSLASRPTPALWAASALVAVAWAATAWLAVPDHNALQAGGPDAQVFARLVTRNWIRTVSWTFAFLLLVWDEWAASSPS